MIIEDSGMGFRAVSYIFDRFYKIDKSRTSSGSGWDSISAEPSWRLMANGLPLDEVIWAERDSPLH